MATRTLIACAVIVVGLVAAVMWLRARHRVELRVGGLYSVDSGEGFFQVAKILALDESAVHVRLYANRFEERPEDVDPSVLRLRSAHQQDSPGIGHMPVTREVLSASRPVFLRQVPVEEEELEGYRMWQDSGGGVWGTE
ncbi:MAG: hypothetical protein U9R79_13175 [Armatimonadota bacterium]|nr:hypothetical protein [Armatimonadota bacterium]